MCYLIGTSSLDGHSTLHRAFIGSFISSFPPPSVESAMRGSRPNTSRPVTTSGRFVRLGTASMVAEAGGPFINVDRLDLRKYASRPALARGEVSGWWSEAGG